MIVVALLMMGVAVGVLLLVLAVVVNVASKSRWPDASPRKIKLAISIVLLLVTFGVIAGSSLVRNWYAVGYFGPVLAGSCLVLLPWVLFEKSSAANEHR